MLKNLQNHIVLWAQAKTGLSGGFLISLAVAAGAALLTFVFLCVTGYAWLSIQLGPVFGGLAMAGLLIAVIGAAASAHARDRTRRRANVERAARAQGTRALIDPKVLSVAMQACLALGWRSNQGGVFAPRFLHPLRGKKAQQRQGNQPLPVERTARLHHDA